MPRPLIWTQDHDLTLRRMRTDGASWDAIAAAVSVSRWSSIVRGRLVGADGAQGGAKRTPKRAAQPQVDALSAELANPNRAPLPAGHAFTWGLLTAGTLLDGSPYACPPEPGAVLS